MSQDIQTLSDLISGYWDRKEDVRRILIELNIPSAEVDLDGGQVNELWLQVLLEIRKRNKVDEFGELATKDCPRNSKAKVRRALEAVKNGGAYRGIVLLNSNTQDADWLVQVAGLLRQRSNYCAWLWNDNYGQIGTVDDPPEHPRIPVKWRDCVENCDYLVQVIVARAHRSMKCYAKSIQTQALKRKKNCTFFVHHNVVLGSEILKPYRYIKNGNGRTVKNKDFELRKTSRLDCDVALDLMDTIAKKDRPFNKFTEPFEIIDYLEKHF